MSHARSPSGRPVYPGSPVMGGSMRAPLLPLPPTMFERMPSSSSSSSSSGDDSDAMRVNPGGPQRSWWRECWRVYNTKIHARDAIRMNAMQKWKYYRRPPWKMFVHFLLLIAITMNLLGTIEMFSGFERANVGAFGTMLDIRNQDIAIDYGGPESLQWGSEDVYLYRVDAFVRSLNYSTFVYFNIGRISLDNFLHVGKDGHSEKDHSDEPIMPMKVTTHAYSQGMDIFNVSVPFTGALSKNEYAIEKVGDLPWLPEQGQKLQEYVNTLFSVKVEFTVQSFEFIGKEKSCFAWNIIQEYDFSGRGRATQKLHLTSELCASEIAIGWWDRPQALLVVYTIIVLVLAAFYQTLIVRSLYRRAFILIKVRGMNKKDGAAQGSIPGNRDSSLDGVAADRKSTSLHPSVNDSGNVNGANNDANAGGAVRWRDLTWSDKMRFFRFWFLLNLLANVCTILGALSTLEQLVLSHAAVPQGSAWLLSSIGALFCWICVIQHLEAFSSYYVLIHTLKLSAPKAARFTIGIFPLFLGYAIFGCAVFSQVSVLFSDLNHACVTLFALTNGDIINDAFEDLGDEFPYLSLIYMYSFISIFIYAVLNIFIAIVEDSFVATKAFQKKYAANKQQQRKLAAKKKAKQLRREQQQQAQQAAIGMPAHAARGGTSSPSMRGLKSKKHKDPLKYLDFGESTMGKRRQTRAARKTRYNNREDADAKGIDSDRDSSMPPPPPFDLEHKGMDPTESSRPLRRTHTDTRIRMPSSLRSRDMPRADTSRGDPRSALMTQIKYMQSEVSEEFREKIQQYVRRVPSASRPPHGPEYYPCSFADCVYCAIRKAYEEALDNALQALTDLSAPNNNDSSIVGVTPTKQRNNSSNI